MLETQRKRRCRGNHIASVFAQRHIAARGHREAAFEVLSQANQRYLYFRRILRYLYCILSKDIFFAEPILGENVLHIAIVNEDPSMVKFLLAANVNIQERCFGNFMCPEDQKSSRTDSLDHEWVNVCPMTNYDG